MLCPTVSNHCTQCTCSEFPCVFNSSSLCSHNICFEVFSVVRPLNISFLCSWCFGISLILDFVSRYLWFLLNSLCVCHAEQLLVCLTSNWIQIRWVTAASCVCRSVETADGFKCTSWMFVFIQEEEEPVRTQKLFTGLITSDIILTESSFFCKKQNKNNNTNISADFQ